MSPELNHPKSPKREILEKIEKNIYIYTVKKIVDSEPIFTVWLLVNCRRSAASSPAPASTTAPAGADRDAGGGGRIGHDSCHPFSVAFLRCISSRLRLSLSLSLSV